MLKRQSAAGGNCRGKVVLFKIVRESFPSGRQNTWIDGSLGDHGWWSEWIKNCRQKFP